MLQNSWHVFVVVTLWHEAIKGSALYDYEVLPCWHPISMHDHVDIYILDANKVVINKFNTRTDQLMHHAQTIECSMFSLH